MVWDIQRGGPWGGSGEGGSDGGGQGPWGGNGGQSGQKPPDIEEMLRRGQDKFKKFIPSGGGGPKRIILLVLAAIVIWLGTGFYRVQPSEQGVELLFGKFVQMTTPGLNYWFPGPIGQVYTPDVTNTNITSVGFRQVGSGGARATNVRDVPEESLMLTGDQNIIDIDYQVQWRIKNAAEFLFNIRNPQETVKLASESAIREIVGQTTLEDALAKQRQQVESQTHEVLQKILDSYGAGVFIDSVKMQKVEPPKQVIDAFNDVQRAKQDRERQQNEAQAYANDIIPKAKGEAAKMIQEATAYKEKLMHEADGEAKRFLSVYEAYKGGKQVTRTRLYLERMQQVLKDSEKVIIDKGQGGAGVIPYLPLPEIKKRSRGKN
ncbi:MAG TPA: FtsH protease activity modulator HflK [Rhodospirillales bacterium]|nr:FtsH protease activity modulator HflK [Rhodospirillales bacterium]HIL76007.1 FtsH protease activity modulator HflK [Rhodospirillales bacterium]